MKKEEIIIKSIREKHVLTIVVIISIIISALFAMTMCVVDICNEVNDDPYISNKPRAVIKLIADDDDNSIYQLVPSAFRDVAFESDAFKQLIAYDISQSRSFDMDKFSNDNFWLGLRLILLALIVLWIVCRFSVVKLIITNKSIRGRTYWKKSVILPIESVKAVGLGKFGSVIIYTEYKSFKFSSIKNRVYIVKVINKLIENSKSSL